MSTYSQKNMNVYLGPEGGVYIPNEKGSRHDDLVNDVPKVCDDLYIGPEGTLSIIDDNTG